MPHSQIWLDLNGIFKVRINCFFFPLIVYMYIPKESNITQTTFDSLLPQPAHCCIADTHMVCRHLLVWFCWDNQTRAEQRNKSPSMVSSRLVSQYIEVGDPGAYPRVKDVTDKSRHIKSSTNTDEGLQTYHDVLADVYKKQASRRVWDFLQSLNLCTASMGLAYGIERGEESRFWLNILVKSDCWAASQRWAIAPWASAPSTFLPHAR